MRFISTRIHGIIDYFLGIALIAAPWLFNFVANGSETWIPVTLGVVLIVYSLFTDYEYGLVNNISVKTHLWLDSLLGIFLASSPWLFNFNLQVYQPHLWVGVLLTVVAIFTLTSSKKTGAYGGIKITKEEKTTREAEPIERM